MLQKTNKLIKISLIAATGVTILSFLIKLVPCIKESKFGLCTIPSPFLDLSTPLSSFYNISNNPLTALILQFLIAFILTFIIILLSKSKPKKVLDLTR